MDTFRGLSAVAVFVCHWRLLAFPGYHEISGSPSLLLKAWYIVTGLGHQAVMAFFVLSGYLVGKSVLENFSAGWQWGPYLSHRLTRLWIVLIPALVLGFGLDTLGNAVAGDSYLYAGQGQPVITWHVLDRATWPVALGNLFFLQGISVPTFGSDTPLWSLSYEFWYYMLFPLLVLAVFRHGKAASRVLYGVSALAIFWLVGVNIAVNFLVWLMGVALVYAPRWKVSSHIWKNVAIGSATVLALTVTNIQRLTSRAAVFDLMLGASYAVLLWTLLQARHPVEMTFWRRCSQGLSGMTYTLYLFHMPLLVLLISLFNRKERWQPDLLHISAAMVILVVVFLFCAGLYYCFERHTGRVRNRIASLPGLREYCIPRWRERAVELKELEPANPNPS